MTKLMEEMTREDSVQKIKSAALEEQVRQFTATIIKQMDNYELLAKKEAHATNMCLENREIYTKREAELLEIIQV